jgi:hypothetical protein
MGDKTSKDVTFTPSQREARKAFQRSGKREAITEYDKAQETFQKNYQRLKAERLAREAAKSGEK